MKFIRHIVYGTITRDGTGILLNDKETVVPMADGFKCTPGEGGVFAIHIVQEKRCWSNFWKKLPTKTVLVPMWYSDNIIETPSFPVKYRFVK